MNEIIGELCKREGRYLGRGINHDKENFEGEFVVNPIINGHGVEIEFKATGDDGTVYHTEKTTLALSHDDKPYLWSINSNAPYVFQHELRRNEKFDGNNTKLIFGFNDSDNKDIFREEIQLELYENGEIGYHYYWGMPGGDFAYRSGLKMKK